MSKFTESDRRRCRATLPAQIAEALAQIESARAHITDIRKRHAAGEWIDNEDLDRLLDFDAAAREVSDD